MIIDDGSADHTEELVQTWIQENIENTENIDNGVFRIEYYYKDNGGLHTAYNEAISHIETELSVCIDSDDYMPYDAVEKILSFWEKNGSDQYAGILGLDYDTQGHLIGDPLPTQKSVNLIDLLIGRYHINNGDRTVVVRTALYKKVAPMKTYSGEKYFNPHYMHLLISKKYDFLVLNENLRYVDYQPGGMTDSIFKQYVSSPRSFIQIRRLYLSFSEASINFRVRHSIHLASSCFLLGKPLFSIKLNPYKYLAAMSLPFGFLLSKWVKFKADR